MTLLDNDENRLGKSIRKVCSTIPVQPPWGGHKSKDESERPFRFAGYEKTRSFDVVRMFGKQNSTVTKTDLINGRTLKYI